LGLDTEKINEITHYDPWFLRQIEEIIIFEKKLGKKRLNLTKIDLQAAKSMGFSDDRLALIAKVSAKKIRELREEKGILPVFKRIDTCAGEFQSKASYLYSTYGTSTALSNDCESNPSTKKKVIILGSGPNRIGQGIEFDYCCCHACFSLSEENIETIMINCNPETVSTDFDTSEKLYFEPLNFESVFNIISTEKRKGDLLGVIVQYGGQTPLKLAKYLQEEKIKVLGTPTSAIEIAEDRNLFKNIVNKLNLLQPKNQIVNSKKEALTLAITIDYPIIVRPSFVLGGRSMEIIYNPTQLNEYLKTDIEISFESPLLLDSYLGSAVEVDVDALSDGNHTFIAGVMEHIEEAGVHSGDSACSLPPHSLNTKTVGELGKQTKLLAKELKVKGLMNVQFAIKDDEVFILEANPRASRTVPFISKAIGKPLAAIGAKLMIGKKLTDFQLRTKKSTHVAVKEAVLPFDRLPGSDTVLTPEMRSTGEVMGIDKSFEMAFFKSQMAAGVNLPRSGNVFISVKDSDKTDAMLQACKTLEQIGFKLLATKGTKLFLDKENIKNELVKKVYQGRPNIMDLLTDNKISIVMNTTEGEQSLKDSKEIRFSALYNTIPYYTTARGIIAAIFSLRENIKSDYFVKSLQEYHI
jgi:carbamoyl-phosphate synthase large subunit